MNERLRLNINGEQRDLVAATNKTLLEVLREDLRLTGTKHGCELGECGTCTVLVDGEPILSCLLLAVDAQDSEIRTIEGLAEGSTPHELQVAFAELGASQCGYCSPGMLVSAAVLLEQRVRPSRQEIGDFLAGNLCRCTGYLKILEAIDLAAGRIEERRRDSVENPAHVSRPVEPAPAAADLSPVEGKRGSA